MYCSVVYDVFVLGCEAQEEQLSFFFPLRSCLCLPFCVHLALSAIEEQKHFHRIYNACALSMHPAQLVDGIHCVGCLPGVTAEQKHLSVVHKDLQKNEEGLGTDD